MKEVVIKPKMNFDTILIRYGEIALKSKQTQRRFLRQLIKNIKAALRGDFVDCLDIRKERGRLFIETNDSKALDALTKVFGIVSVSPVVSCPPTIEDAVELSVSLSKKLIKKKNTFAIRCRRAGIHDFTSRDAANAIGAAVQKATASKVNLTSPDKELFVEIRQSRAYVFKEILQGPGGLPMGIEGKVAVLYENKNSLLAAWLVAKRGCEVEFVCTPKKLSSLESHLKKFRPWFGSITPKVAENTLNPMILLDAQALVSGVKTPKKALELHNKSPLLTLFPLVGFPEKMEKRLKKEFGL